MSSIVAEVLAAVSSQQRDLNEQLDTAVRAAYSDYTQLARLIDDIMAQFVPSAIPQAASLTQQIDQLIHKIDQNVAQFKMQVKTDCVKPSADQMSALSDRMSEVQQLQSSLSIIRELSDCIDQYLLLSADSHSLRMADLLCHMEIALAKLCKQVEASQAAVSQAGDREGNKENSDQAPGMKLAPSIPLSHSSAAGHDQPLSLIKDPSLLSATARMLPGLNNEFATHKDDLVWTLSKFWGSLFKWELPMGRNRTDESISVKLNKENIKATLKINTQMMRQADTKQRLVAMQRLDVLDERMTQLADTLYTQIVLPILRGHTVQGLLIVQPISGVCSTSELSFTCEPKPDTATKSDILWHVNQLVDLLAENVGNTLNALQLDDAQQPTSFIQLLGLKLGDRIMNELCEKCVKASLPLEDDDKEEAALFHTILAQTEEMLSHWQEMQFVGVDYAGLADVLSHKQTSVTDRRCQVILDVARTLIKHSLFDTQQVGSAEEDCAEAVQTLKDRLNELGTQIKEGDLLDARNEFEGVNAHEKLPPMFQFPKCRISTNCYKLSQLIESTIKKAIAADTPSAAGRHYECSRLILELYVTITPLAHERALTTVPNVAALFYTNCYYLAHGCMLFGEDYGTQLQNSMKLDQSDPVAVPLTYVQYVPILRALATDCMDLHLKQRCSEMDQLLPHCEMFTDLSSGQRLCELDRAVTGCVRLLEQIDSTWRQTLPMSVHLRALGVLCAHLLNLLFSRTCALEDIAAKDATFIADIVQRTTKTLEKMFLVRGVLVDSIPTHHRFVAASHAKSVELVLMLNGTLQQTRFHVLVSNSLVFMCYNGF